MSKKKTLLKRLFVTATIVCMVLCLNTAALAYTMDWTLTTPRDPGMPTFSGSGAPSEPISSYDTHSMMQAIYDEDMDDGGTSFWMDRMLRQTGVNPDTNDLFTRGKMLYLSGHRPNTLGFGGGARYGFTVSDTAGIFTMSVSGVTLTESTSSRVNAPSYWSSVYNGSSLRITERKFITDNNVAVALLDITNTGSSSRNVTLNASSSFATSASGNELRGTVNAPNTGTLTTVSTKLSGDSMTVSGTSLTRTMSIGAGATVQAKVQMGWITDEIEESSAEYDAYKAYNTNTAFATHVQDYNQWWVDNVPYLDVPDSYVKKILYYRWWINRFNSIDGDIPGNDWQFPTCVEGALGYGNIISVSVPWILDDIKYLRNPIYSYGTWLGAGECANDYAYRDNPGVNGMWNKKMMQYTSRAGWGAYKLHGGPLTMLKNFAEYAENDINGQFNTYDGNNNKLIAYSDSTLTGNDGCCPSMNYYSTTGREILTERIDASAYNYGNVVAAAEMYDYMGNTAKAAEMNTLANTIKTNFVNAFWSDSADAFLHVDAATGRQSPWKDNNFNGYWMGVVPTNDSKYKEMFRLFNNSTDYLIFPFMTGDYSDIAARYNRDRSTGLYDTWYANTFCYANAGVNMSVFAAGIKEYENNYVTADDLKQLLYWDCWIHCVDDGNANFLDANEFYWLANTNNDTKIASTMSQTGPIVRSWIHHNQLGKLNSNVIEDIMGFTPREDEKVELYPIDIGWDHFTVNNIRYHNTDVTVVWDEPGDSVIHYAGVPEGYSVYMNGTRVFTVNSLVHVLWDAATGAVTFPDGDSATVNYHVSYTSLQEASEVTYTDDRVIDIFQKAGRDVSTATEPADLALNTSGSGYPSPSASYTASGTSLYGALDGYTIVNTWWGNRGTSNSEDYYQINFGQNTTLNTVKAYFYNNRTSGGYREPSSFRIRYLNGATWTDVSNASYTPGTPVSNYNKVTFNPVTTNQIRVYMTRKSGYYVGLKEVQAFNTSATNNPPTVNAGADRTFLLTEDIALSGTASDDGLPSGTLNTTWSLVSGPSTADIDDASDLNTTATVSAVGTYVFRLTASDGALSANDTVSMTVIEGGGDPDVLWYKFDETSGTTAADSSGNNDDATLVNGAVWTAGHGGNAVNLDGSDQYVSMPAGVLSGLNDFTIAAWVKLDTIGSWERVFDFGTGTTVNMFLTVSSGSYPRYAITTSGGSSEQRLTATAALPAGDWTHVAVTLSGNTGTFYVNGAAVATNTSMTLSPSDLGNTNRNYIGRSQYSGDSYLDGLVDDFRVYGRALSASEVDDLAVDETENAAPTVDAGADSSFELSEGITLSGTASDDGLPSDTLTTTWSQVSGPSTADIDDAGELTTTADVSAAGTYVFQLEADDGELSSTDTVTMTVTEDSEDDPDVLWYKFDETSGTMAADSSGNGDDATLVNDATWTTGHSGNAVNLDGSDQYVSMPSGVLSSLDDFTIAAWVRLDTIGNWERVFDFGTGTTVNMFLTVSDGSRPRYAITTNGNGNEQQLTATAALPTGAWTHVAVTLSGNTGTFYVNGAAVATNTSMSLSPSDLGATNRNYIGRSQYSGDGYLDGLVDDFRVYSRALSSSEIGELYSE